MKSIHKTLVFAFVVISSGYFALEIAGETQTGIVVLHDNGHPTKHIKCLVSKLKSSTFLVAQPEMPFSTDRRYDKSVDEAVKQVDSAISDLKAKGAAKIFIAGHSKGGVFALYYASKYPTDGLIAIAPGGNVGSKVFRNKVGDSVDKARQMIAAGEGNKVDTFQDYEGARGVTDLDAPAASYFSWYDPEGAMNVKRSAQRLSAAIPVLWIVAKDDYPGLKKVNIPMFEALPSNPKSRLYEPDTDHKGAPVESADEIIRWLTGLIR